ncbi:MAG: hypothetical protein JXQ73_03675 [Phycisphaerae bacterium]|nr:hypothetical protein [Phycisphaerae bacterium]
MVTTRHSTIRNTIVAGFVLLGILSLLTGVTGLYFVHSVVGVLNNVTDYTSPLVEGSDDLIMNLWEATKVAEEILADEELEDIRALTMEFRKLSGQFGRTYAGVLDLCADGVLRTKLENARARHTELVGHAEQMISARTKELEKRILVKRLLSEFDEIGSQLGSRLGTVAEGDEVTTAALERRGEGAGIPDAGAWGPDGERRKSLGEGSAFAQAALKLEHLTTTLQLTSSRYLLEEDPKKLGPIEREFQEAFSQVEPRLALMERTAGDDEERHGVAELKSLTASWQESAIGAGGLLFTYREQLAAGHHADELTEELEADADAAAAALNVVANAADRVSEEADDIGVVVAAPTVLVAAIVSSIVLIISMGTVITRVITTSTGQLEDTAERLRRSEAELRESHDVLERRVLDRTAELRAANERLRKEITDRERAEELSRRHQAELAHASRLSTVGELASGLAHELNQPLNAIVSYCVSCTQRIQSGALRPDGLLALMEKATRQAQRAGEILHRIRGFVRRRESFRSTTDINGLVREAVSFVDYEARQRGIQIELQLDDSLPPILVNRIEIEQVIINLLKNGFESMSEMKASDARLVVATSHCLEDGIEVAVSDRGAGFDKDVGERLFEPFFTTKADGMGMGLAISQTIIKAHGGRLWATPYPDLGATFTFVLPVAGRSHDDGI